MNLSIPFASPEIVASEAGGMSFINVVAKSIGFFGVSTADNTDVIALLNRL
jgi:hypothetical protein